MATFYGGAQLVSVERLGPGDSIQVPSGQYAKIYYVLSIDDVNVGNLIVSISVGSDSIRFESAGARANTVSGVAIGKSLETISCSSLANTNAVASIEFYRNP